MNAAEQLQAVRDSLGPPGKRNLSSANRVRIPGWVNLGHPLRALTHKQGLLLRLGEPVWAALVQANSKIFELNSEALPGAVLYSPDPESFARPAVLARAAQNLFSSKGQTGGDPRLQGLIEAVADERQTILHQELPASASEGLYCLYTSVLFDPRHLPGGVLNLRVFPVLRHPKSQAVLVVPHWHWPEELFELRLD